MRLTNLIVRRTIERLLNGENYRPEILSLIDAEFLDFVIAFFRRVVEAKLRQQTVTPDWYRHEFLRGLDSKTIAIHAGLNMKTIRNVYGTGRREIVLEASQEHFERLYSLIDDLAQQDEIDVQLTLKFNGVSVELTLSESLIVINTLAVKRAELRGSLWSAVGKQVEKPLMLTLCKLFQVPESHHKSGGREGREREVDFRLVSSEGKEYLCEVKLMGKGNPESADATFARRANIFIADTLSDSNKAQLERAGIAWVELKTADGWRRFGEVLENLDIPHNPFMGDLAVQLAAILDQLFPSSS